MDVSAVAAHNNTIHLDENWAVEADGELHDAIRLSNQLGVGTVTCFSGLPSGSLNAEVLNWITAP
ncbi:MAG: hypothetical protein RI568_14305 [Natronomonas sp.]|nr:hypothetical protein [Natronomonas sp.]MDR9431854.1 hypothetical protein [Natronomonas sp.]